jgi:NAD(P)-dependent dehydrogenase (short-subunit alcohol dehydrogenase family)
MTNLENKVAFITGGVSGLGLGLARRFLSEGMKVIITYMRESVRDEAMTYLGPVGDRIHTLQLDVTDRSAVAKAAIEAERVFGKIHVLCNNAGVNILGPMDEASIEDWDWILNVNLYGTIHTVQHFVPRIKSHGEGGHILNVASMGAILAGPEMGIYATSKFAIRGLSESLRYCLARYKIGVSVFCPGLIDSRIYESGLNRPARFASPETRVHSNAINEEWKKVQAFGMDPLEAADMAVKGIAANKLYIFSHPDLKDDVQTHFNEILGEFPLESPDPRRASIVEARRRLIAARKNLGN